MIAKEVARAVAKTVREMELAAKLNTPHRSGTARGSISSEVTVSGSKVTAIVGGGSREAWYFRFLEFGTAAYVVPKLRKSGKTWALLKIGGDFVKGRFQIPARRGMHIIGHAVNFRMPKFTAAAAQGVARGTARMLRRAVR